MPKGKWCYSHKGCNNFPLAEFYKCELLIRKLCGMGDFTVIVCFLIVVIIFYFISVLSSLVQFMLTIIVSVKRAVLCYTQITKAGDAGT